MLEAMLDFLVGKKAIKFDGQQYSLTGYIPLPFSIGRLLADNKKREEEWARKRQEQETKEIVARCNRIKYSCF